MTAATAVRERAEIPRIRLLSLPGIESAGWGIVIGHYVKWVVDALYFLVFQVSWGFGYPPGRWHTWWALKNPWDHAPLYLGRFLGLLGWHVGWLFLASTDRGWTEPRHLARDVGIGLVAGVIITFMFAKPSRPAEDRVSAVRYALTLPMALLFAVPGIAAVAVLAWKLPWLLHHGLAVPGSGVLASEVNGWISAGRWAGAAMGIAGSQFFARYASRRPADDAQWFYAERSAARIRRGTGLGRLRGTRVIGTPAHRVRVRWLLEHRTRDLPDRSPWAVRILVGAMFVATILAGFGAWLTLAGPAAHAA